MICKNCTTAGEIIARYREASPFGDELMYVVAVPGVRSTSVLTSAVFGAVANTLHGICVKGGCDCQHKLDWKDSLIKREGLNG